MILLNWETWAFMHTPVQWVAMHLVVVLIGFLILDKVNFRFSGPKAFYQDVCMKFVVPRWYVARFQNGFRLIGLEFDYRKGKNK